MRPLLALSVSVSAAAILGCPRRPLAPVEGAAVLVAPPGSGAAPAAVDAPPGPCPAGMILVPAGPVRVGHDGGEDEEKPVHEVSVATFCIDRTEVTAAAYRACLRAGRCDPPGRPTVASDPPLCNLDRPDRSEHPMNCVERREAARFCAQRGARLPTEIEWEKAARGADGRLFPWGNAPASGRACVGDETCPVGSFPRGASPFGVLDMSGNVRELTASPWCPYAPADASCPPWSPISSRGGSFRSDPGGLRASARTGEGLGERSASLGFRCVVGDPLPPPRPQPDVVARMCECFKSAHAQPSCDVPETEFIGGVDPDCVRTYARDCPMMIACSRGEPGAAPRCLPGHANWGALRACGKVCRKDADCLSSETCSQEWGRVCVPR